MRRILNLTEQGWQARGGGISRNKGASSCSVSVTQNRASQIIPAAARTPGRCGFVFPDDNFKSVRPNRTGPHRQTTHKWRKILLQDHFINTAQRCHSLTAVVLGSASMIDVEFAFTNPYAHLSKCSPLGAHGPYGNTAHCARTTAVQLDAAHVPHRVLYQSRRDTTLIEFHQKTTFTLARTVFTLI